MFVHYKYEWIYLISFMRGGDLSWDEFTRYTMSLANNDSLIISSIPQKFPQTIAYLAISIKVIFKLDKKTLIRLATPASIFALAVSIICVPIITKAEFYNGADVYFTHMNSCS